MRLFPARSRNTAPQILYEKKPSRVGKSETLPALGFGGERKRCPCRRLGVRGLAQAMHLQAPWGSGASASDALAGALGFGGERSVALAGTLGFGGECKHCPCRRLGVRGRAQVMPLQAPRGSGANEALPFAGALGFGGRAQAMPPMGCRGEAPALKAPSPPVGGRGGWGCGGQALHDAGAAHRLRAEPTRKENHHE